MKKILIDEVDSKLEFEFALKQEKKIEEIVSKEINSTKYYRRRASIINFLDDNMEQIFYAAKSVVDPEADINYVSSYVEFKSPDYLELELDCYPVNSDLYKRLIAKMKFLIALELTKHSVQIPFIYNISVFNDIDINRAFKRAIKMTINGRYFTEEEIDTIKYSKLHFELNQTSEFCLIDKVELALVDDPLYSTNKYAYMQGRIEKALYKAIQTEFLNHRKNPKLKYQKIDKLSDEFIETYILKHLEDEKNEL